MGDVEDLIRWMSDFKTGMRASGPMGALPDTAQKQFDKFMVGQQYFTKIKTWNSDITECIRTLSEVVTFGQSFNFQTNCLSEPVC